MQKIDTQINLRYVCFLAAVASIGGFVFGYDAAVIAGAIGFLQTKFELTAAMTGWAVSSAIVGCILGASIAGHLSDLYGRKKTLIVTAILFSISAIGSAIPIDMVQFSIARLIGGLAVGAASMLAPMYISEIAPASIRGRLVTLYQLAIVLGIMIIYFVNMVIAGLGNETWNIEMGWRMMLASESLPALLFLIMLLFIPESPRWMAMKNKDQNALQTLTKIYGIERAQGVLDEIKGSLNEEKGRLRELLEPGIRKPMVIGIFLAIFSQITGINAIMFYAPEIFKSIGFGTDSALFQTVIIGIFNTGFTLVALWLVDKLGRKTLLIYGVGGMALCLLGLGSAFQFNFSGPWVLIFILGYIAFFAISLGPIPWVILSEIFPTKMRGLAMSISTLTMWSAVYFVSQFFPILIEKIGSAFTFWIFMTNAIVLLFFTVRIIPETKGKTLEEIEKSWSIID